MLALFLLIKQAYAMESARLDMGMHVLLFKPLPHAAKSSMNFLSPGGLFLMLHILVQVASAQVDFVDLQKMIRRSRDVVMLSEGLLKNASIWSNSIEKLILDIGQVQPGSLIAYVLLTVYDAHHSLKIDCRYLIQLNGPFSLCNHTRGVQILWKFASVLPESLERP